ncbi:MAG: NAD(P)/FAD-dependent oxidoreductase [Clostridia bacterium]|nr:NAD(P)/FAD-dependent oxidoreductase [Clostridia bacterium]
MRVDVLIIGGGVVGCAIARALSGKEVTVALAEAREDVAMGASRANSAIVHAGYDAPPDTMMARLGVRGNALYGRWCEDLEVPFQRVGSLVIAFDAADERTLIELLEKGRQNGVPGLTLLSGERARMLEPALSPSVSQALYAETGAITCPYEMTIACYENARANGLTALTDAPVTAIEQENGCFRVRCGPHSVTARYIINAAGLFADDIARMVGDDHFTLRPRKGEYMLFDRSETKVRTVVFQTPSNMGKGVLVSPTVDGNMFVGPTARDQASRTDFDVTEEGLAELMALSKKSVPAIDYRAVITSFAGLRAHSSTGDFVIKAHGRMLHAAGICSPGLTSAPAIAEQIISLLEKAGLPLPDKKGFFPKRPHMARFSSMSRSEREKAIADNPLYGRIVCRCETVTEAEIVCAVRRGARSLDAIKRRTRAGMGRCQGGFCSPRVMEILCRETGMRMTEITKFGGKSVVAPFLTRGEDNNA